MNGVFVLGRVALVVIFIFSGVQKLLDIAGTASQIEAKLSIPATLADLVSQIESALGMPIWQVLALVIAVVEVVSGLLIAFNILTRTAAAVLVVFVAVGTFFSHDFWNMADPDRTNNVFHALKNLSIMGALLMVAAWPRRVIVADVHTAERVEPL
jgi:uncharacterized membrane protein YphA (DoxX/SURF4 family)